MREIPIRPPLARLAGAIASDRRGTTMVEFGLVAVPFFGLLLALFQTGLVFFASEGLEAAVQNGARNIMIGTAQGSSVTTGAQFLSTYVCPATGPRMLPSYIDCNSLIVDVRTAASFSSIDTSADFWQSGSSTQYCPGTSGSIVIVRVIYPMPALMPIVVGTSNPTITRSFSGLVNTVPNNPGWKQLLLATAVFQNEPNRGNNNTLPGC